MNVAADADLVLTDEQLTLIAAQAGFQSFPGARAPSLGAAGWKLSDDEHGGLRSLHPHDARDRLLTLVCAGRL